MILWLAVAPGIQRLVRSPAKSKPNQGVLTAPGNQIGPHPRAYLGIPLQRRIRLSMESQLANLSLLVHLLTDPLLLAVRALARSLSLGKSASVLRDLFFVHFGRYSVVSYPFILLRVRVRKTCCQKSA